MSNNIIISQQNVTGPCDLKCAYTFKYNESSSTATNNGSFISLTYDNGSTPPVLFNNQKYKVDSIRIVAPSIHTFNNTKSPAEIYIEHTPVSGGPLLLVCIPIISSTNSSTSSNLITQIIQSVTGNAPRNGEKTNLNISGFTLDNIIPNKPYYNYLDAQNNVWVVFDISNGIPINSSVLSSLSRVISNSGWTTTGASLFYNSKGPNSSGTAFGDGIYISCQPTGSSEEQTNVSYEKNSTSYDLSSMTLTPNIIFIIIIIAGCFIFIVVFVGVNYAYNYFISDSIRLPSIPSL